MKTFNEFINESSTEKPKSVDLASDRIKDGERWGKPIYHTKPPKVVYLKKGAKNDAKISEYLKTTYSEKALYVINPSLWIKAYMRQNGENLIESVVSHDSIEYKEIQKLTFKEFNVYCINAKMANEEYHNTSWFITKQDAMLKGNLQKFASRFGLTAPEEEKGPKESWAIISAKMGRYEHYGWLSNDGSSDSIMEPKDFKRAALRSADRLADKHFYQHVGGNAKIYYNKEKFASDFEKLSGNKPNLQ